MSLFSMDIEYDSDTPASGSIVSIGAVKVEKSLDRGIFIKLKPITDKYKQKNLDFLGIKRKDQFENTMDAEIALKTVIKFIKANSIKSKPEFLSDTLGKDWMWFDYYCDYFNMINPFGYSGRRLADICSGLFEDLHKPWKHLRDTPENTHNPLQDALENAKVIFKLEMMGLKI